MEPMQHHNSSQSAGSKQQPSSPPARIPAPPSLLPAVLHRLGLNRETLPVEQLSASLAHPDWSVRASAIHQLETMEKRIAIPLLQSALQDEHAAVRATAVSMMGKLGEYTFLLESLGDSDWQVREAAVLALGAPGTHAPIEPLLAAQHDPDAAVREAAQYPLRTHSTRAFPLTDSRAQQPIDGEMGIRQALSFQATEWQAQRESENGLTNEHVVLASGQIRQIIAHIGGTKHMKEVMTPEQMPTRRFAPEEGRTTPARRTPRFKFTPLWRTLSICAAIVVVVVNIAAWGILTQWHHGQPGIQTQTQTGTATVPAGKRLYTYSFGKGKAMNDLAWSPDGKHMAAAIGEIAHGTVHIWDATNGGHEVIYTPSPSANQHVDSEVYATSVAWSPDGKRLASAIGDVQVWDVATGRILTRYFPPLSSGLGTVNTIAWSPDGKYLAGAFASWNTNGICIWDTRTGKLVHMFQSNNEMPSRAWSPNGKYLLTIGNAVEVWSMPTGQLVSTHTQHSVQNAAWSPDSTRIASADSDGTVQIWDALTGHGRLTYTGHVNQGAGVEALAWSPDGKRLVSSGSDIQIWNAATGKLIFVYTGQHSSKGSPYLRPLAWSPNGKLIASGEQQPRDAGGNIQVWEGASSNAA